MSLSVSTLESGLRPLFENPPLALTQTAKLWAAAYADYAASAQSTLGAPVSVAAAKATLQTAIYAALVNQRSPVPTTFTAFATAFTAFWMAPPIVFSGAFPGLVTLVGGTAALPSALIAVGAQVMATRCTPAVAAKQYAAALHLFTLTVIVTHATVPTPTPGPIS